MTLRRATRAPSVSHRAGTRAAPCGWLQLSEADNVVVLTRGVAAGEELRGPGDERWRADRQLAVGHKLAARPIASGETVLKYGFPIGVATQAIAPGEHVHTHNLASSYRALRGEG